MADQKELKSHYCGLNYICYTYLLTYLLAYGNEPWLTKDLPHHPKTPVKCVPLCTTASSLVSESMRRLFANRNLVAVG